MAKYRLIILFNKLIPYYWIFIFAFRDVYKKITIKDYIINFIVRLIFIFIIFIFSYLFAVSDNTILSYRVLLCILLASFCI